MSKNNHMSKTNKWKTKIQYIGSACWFFERIIKLEYPGKTDSKK